MALSNQDVVDALKKSTKPEANYGASKGSPTSHCGPDTQWPKGYCSMYREENRCTAVQGFIDHKGWCRYFEKAKGA